MFKHYFESIQGIEIYPVISLLIFFIFFILLFAWVIKADKKYIDNMKNLPLDPSEPNHTAP
jgi:cytochrome c oxidase cbb3-type subunit IV